MRSTARVTLPFVVRALALACSIVPLVARAAGAPSYELVRVQRAIDAANHAYVAALVKKDAVAFGDLFTVDAVSMPNHAPIVHGRDGVVASMSGVFARLTFTHGAIRTLEMHLAGDTASEIGTYEFEVIADGNVRTLRGRYLTIWREVDGVWKIAIDSSQPDAPA